MTTRAKKPSVKRTSLVNAKKFLSTKYAPLSLGEAIHSERLCREMNLTEFATEIGMSVQHLSDIEKGRRFLSPEKASELAEVIGDSKALFVELALQDSLRRSGLPFFVKVEAA